MLAPSPSPSPRRLPATLAVCAAALALAGCGKSEQYAGGGPTRKLAPVAAQGAVSLSTRNTTRLGGADTPTDAAAVARAVYPGLTAATRPQAVVLVNIHSWPAALAASVLSSAPLNAPILFSEGNTLPAVTSRTLRALHPLGAATLGGAQVIALGTAAAVPHGYLTRSLPVGTPAATAAAVERLLVTVARGAKPHDAIVVPANAAPALAMPAAGLAAESGAPIVPITAAGVPPASAAVLRSLRRPSIFVIDAAAASEHAIAALRRLGTVTTVTAGAPTDSPVAAVAGAIAVARFTNGTFGWGVKEPGHGLVFANAARPFDAPAAALLSATGDYGPLLLLDSATQLPSALSKYLSDIQPAYTAQVPPVRGLYNRGWLIGDERAISAVTQAEIDSALEIAETAQSSGEAVSEEEQSTTTSE